MGVLRRWFGTHATPRPTPSSPLPDPPTYTIRITTDGVLHRPPSNPDGHDSWYVPSDRDPERFRGPDGLPAIRLIPYQSYGEAVLRLCEDATGLLIGPTDLRLPAVGVYVSNLRGASYHQQACTAGDFTPGAPVRLTPEPDNPHDPKAVAVYDATGVHHAAYLNKQKARMVLRRLGTGTRLAAISIRGSGPGRACPQLTILAAEPQVIAHLLSPRPRSLPLPAHLR